MSTTSTVDRELSPEIEVLELDVEKLNNSLRDKLVAAYQTVENGLSGQAAHFICVAQQIHNDIISIPYYTPMV